MAFLLNIFCFMALEFCILFAYHAVLDASDFSFRSAKTHCNSRIFRFVIKFYKITFFIPIQFLISMVQRVFINNKIHTFKVRYPITWNSISHYKKVICLFI